MTYKLALAAAVMLSSANAFAADNRIQTIKYDPDQVVKIVGRPGVQSTIEFEDGERIENVAVGNSDAWQITPNRRASALFLKPLARATATNMTVITDQRVYMFDLVARGSAGAPVYALRFQYPDAKPKAVQSPKMADAEADADAGAMASFTPAQLFFGWQKKGHKRLLPARVFDDGTSLYLSWSGDNPLPAVLTMSPDGKEGPINYRTAGEYIVIDPVPGAILLRQGKMEARVWRSTPVSRRAPSRAAPPAIASVPKAPPPPSIVARAATPEPRPAVSQPAAAVISAAAPQSTATATNAAAHLRTLDVRTLLTDQLSETANGQ
jgi:type IV secretion system protein VirB9